MDNLYRYSEAHERMATTPSATSQSLGPRFNAVSRTPGGAKHQRRRRMLLESLARPVWEPWRKRAVARAADAAAAELRASDFFEGRLTRRAAAAWRLEASQATCARNRRAAAAFAKTSLTAALRRWIEFTDESGDQREALKRALGKFMHATLSSSFGRWCEHVDNVRAAHRAVSYFVNAAVWGAWVRWTTFLDESTTQREAFVKAARRFRNVALAGSFRRWVESVEEAAEMRGALAKAIRRFHNKVAAASFRRWVEFADEAAERREALARAVGRFRNASLGGSFRRWREAAEELAELRAKMQRVMARLAMRAVVGLYNLRIQLTHSLKAPGFSP